MRRILVGTAGLVLGLGSAGAAVLVGAVPAGAQSSGSACQQVASTLASIQQVLPQAASNPQALSSKVATFAGQLHQEAASGSPALQSAVGSFITDLQAAASGQVNTTKLTADAGAITQACAPGAAAPTGAPATGGGSTAGLQDEGLLAAGGAAVLGGSATLALAWRRRREASA